MTLHETIKGGIKQAMIAKDQVRLLVLRGLVADFTNELVTKGRMPNDMLTDDEALVVLKRAAKKRKDSIEQFEKGGRPELAADEKAELAIVETFLPATMAADEIRKIAEAKKAELGITDKQKLGQLVGAVMRETAGKADGNDVKAVVESLFT